MTVSGFGLHEAHDLLVDAFLHSPDGVISVSGYGEFSCLLIVVVCFLIMSVCFQIIIVCFLLGFGGLLAAWSGLFIPTGPEDYGNTIFFNLFLNSQRKQVAHCSGS